LLNPFLLFSAVIWLYALINDNANDTFYILTGIVQALTLYKVLIAMWCPLTCWERFAYYLFYPVYYIIGPLFGVSVLCYSLYNMDDFGWGKTRTVI
jgi:chitin synthase